MYIYLINGNLCELIKTFGQFKIIGIILVFLYKLLIMGFKRFLNTFEEQFFLTFPSIFFNSKIIVK